MLFFKKCDSCKHLFWRKNMIHNIAIGVHYPWSFCKPCYESFFNKNKVAGREETMKELKHDLLTNKYTRVLHEDDEQIKFNAPHHFVVNSVDGKNLAQVNFQEGPIKENGVNGVCNEDLIHMVIARLEGFQNSPFSSRDNAMAITKLEEALLWLRKRTIGRENRGVEGTNAI